MLSSYEILRENLARKEAQKDMWYPRKREILRQLDLFIFRMVTEGDAAVNDSRVFLASIESVLADLPEEGSAFVDSGAGESGGEAFDSKDAICEKSLVLSFLCGFHRERRLEEKKTEISDAAYLGALLVLPHEIAKVAVLRHEEAGRVRRLIGRIRDEAAFYDFRNGQLRRKFDAVKWRLVELEDLCFSLEMHDRKFVEEEIEFPEHSVKRTIENLRKFDERREDMIKNMRDVTRLSKMAINALHRDEREKYEDNVKKAAEISDRMYLSHVAVTEGLRWNFSGGVEEWLEAKFFAAFLERAEVPEWATLPWAPTTEEVVGALSDVTGEVGRWAVNKKTKEGVEKALKYVRTIFEWMLSAGMMGKKKTAVMQNMAKLEKMLSDIKIKGRVAIDDLM